MWELPLCVSCPCAPATRTAVSGCARRCLARAPYRRQRIAPDRAPMQAMVNSVTGQGGINERLIMQFTACPPGACPDLKTPHQDWCLALLRPQRHAAPITLVSAHRGSFSACVRILCQWPVASLETRRFNKGTCQGLGVRGYETQAGLLDSGHRRRIRTRPGMDARGFTFTFTF